ncbi:Crp/Fnr family transcriptional regulator [Halalkalibacillus sediminis]|uniref:Crp/Fnr family transcriptional regulator n=1 Tax=Halalkalibacillus sediminis TaxID=2018042 RepID=A0A2I0QS01_9BACI|nr:Crp/Fnr family transcriptional regulator [Halalkalibacillus sediminis]PKR77104.1 Crp/Fnr family transcriptional regulator [Halalkalibacillus sediminis]
MSCPIEFFRQFTIFRDLTDEELVEISDISHQKSIKKHENIFLEGDRREEVFFIQSGLVKIYKLSEEGEEQIISILHSNEMFPHVGFFDDSPYPATAFTLTDTELLSIPIEAFEEWLIRNPKVTIKVMKVIGEKLLQLQERVQTMTTPDVMKRVVGTLCSFIHELGEEDRSDGSIHVRVPITNSEFANLVGVRRETVNRTFSKLKKEGILSYNRQEIVIHNFAELNRI